LSVANKLVHLIRAELGGSFYIKTTNSNNTNKKIRMINEKINKSFLNILSSPFIIEVWPHPTIKYSYIIIANFYSALNIFIH